LTFRNKRGLLHLPPKKCLIFAWRKHQKWWLPYANGVAHLATDRQTKKYFLKILQQPENSCCHNNPLTYGVTTTFGLWRFKLQYSKLVNFCHKNQDTHISYFLHRNKNWAFTVFRIRFWCQTTTWSSGKLGEKLLFFNFKHFW